MKGYVAKKGDRWYAVIYEGLDPVTGKEHRSWHAAGTNRQDAEQLAARLAKMLNGRNDEGRSLSFGAYLTTRWLPGHETRVDSFDVGRVSAQDRPAHPPHPRQGVDPPAASPSSRGALRPEAAPDRRTQTACAEDGVGDPSHHPRRPQGRRPTRNRDTQRCVRGPRTEAPGDPEGGTASLDSPTAARVSPYCGRSSTVPRTVADLDHWDATQRATGSAMEERRPQRGDAVDQPRTRLSWLRDTHIAWQDQQLTQSN